MADPEEILLEQMREMRRRRAAPVTLAEKVSFGQICADWVAANMGSWRFILFQSAMLIVWIGWNATQGGFDPYPFILLNLVLSFQAAYAAPIIMMSQNRQSDIDRARDIEDFDVNRKAELEIELLHEKIDLLRAQDVAALTAAVERLTRVLEQRGATP